MIEDPNKSHEGLSAEQQEIAEEWLAKYETPEIPKEERKDCKKLVADLEAAFRSFENAFSVEQLYAIINPTPTSIPENEIRDTAKEWLKPMTDALKKLEETTDITADKLAELKATFKNYSNAVGFVSSKPGGVYVIEHDR